MAANQFFWTNNAIAQQSAALLEQSRKADFLTPSSFLHMRGNAANNLASRTALAATGGSLLPSWESILQDAVMRRHSNDGCKRSLEEGNLSDRSQGSAKRLKSSSFYEVTTKKSALLVDNPILLNRIINLGGGVPMPRKWKSGTAKTDESTHEQQQSQKYNLRDVDRISSGGAFPMPSLTGQMKDPMIPSLASYKEKWSNTEPELRRQALSSIIRRGNGHL